MTDTPWPTKGTPADVEALTKGFPEWFSPYLPVQPPHQARIIWDGKNYGCWFSDSGYISQADSLHEAYSKSRTLSQDVYDIALDKSLLRSPLGQMREGQDEPDLHLFFEEEGRPADSLGMLTIPATANGYSTMLNDRLWAESITELREAFIEAHQAARNWLDDQKNPATAYEFINKHPSFWSYTASSNGSSEGHWMTEGGYGIADTSVYVRDGKMFVAIETGPHHEDNHFAPGDRYFDPELTGRARTWEKALTKLARNLYTRYDTCGNERPEPILLPASSADADLSCLFHHETTRP